MVKKDLKRAIAFLLTVGMLLSFGISVFAKNGPYTKEDAFSGYLHFIALDENGDPVLEEVNGYEEYKIISVFSDNKVREVDGAVYDRTANTLTLTDFQHPDYMLTAFMMGDDFTLEISGDCSLARITLWGETWGCSLHITGYGYLTVNNNLLFDSGVIFNPGGSETLAFSVDPNTKVNIQGKETAFEVWGFDRDFQVNVGSQVIPMQKKNAVREEPVWVFGYASPGEVRIPLCTCSDDPTGIYGMREQYSDSGECTVFLERFIYTEKYGYYVVDQAWMKAHGDGGSVEFPSIAAANAAGYFQETDSEGEVRWLYCSGMDERGQKQVLQAADGSRYVTGFEYDDDYNTRQVAMTMEPIAEIPGAYFFFKAPGVDPAALKEVTETVTYNDAFDYVFAEKGFILDIIPDRPVIPGDVNDDGRITAADARLALRAAVQLEKYASGSRQFRSADVNHDGKITAADARLILRAAVGLEQL